MKAVFIVNRTDNWHSYASFNLLGVATSLKKAIKLIKKQANIEKIKLSKSDLVNLKEQLQTSLSNFEGEFDIEKIELNELQ